MLAYLGIIQKEINDYRDISIFISHIRFSLLIDVSIFYLLYSLWEDYNSIPISKKFLYSINILWLIFFLFVLKSLTGIVIFITVFFYFLYIIFKNDNNKKFKIIISSSFFIFLILITTWLINSIKNFYSIKENISNLDKYTINNNPYFHDTLNKDIENGYYLWINICDKELEKEWNKKSNLDFWGKDNKGQYLRTTLIRYMTSKGLKKDSSGFSKLTNEDIKNIENGNANYLYAKKWSFYSRIHQLLWEIEQCKKNANKGGLSFMQRTEYIKTAFEIIKRHPLIGVGTGDVKDEFTLQYKISHSKLEPKYQLRTHNQYITFIVTFGIIGFLIIVLCFIFAIKYENKHKDNLFKIIFFIALLSFLNEDTLETHIGVSFFAFFFSFLMYGYKNNSKQQIKT